MTRQNLFRTGRFLAAGLVLALLAGSLLACIGTPNPPITGQPQAGSALPASISYKPEDPLPLAPELSRATLPNGLTTYVRFNGNPGGRIILYLVIAAGSADETEEQLGYAHFIEHMAFNGSASFPKNELVNYLRSIGIRFGAEINAYTSRENTVFQLEIPTDQRQYLETGLQVLRDWATAITFDPAEVEKEKGVILEEMRLRLNPHEAARNAELPVLLGDSRHAFRDPIGSEASIRNATAESLRAFFSEHYRPERMAVIAVGDLNHGTMVRTLRETFNFTNADGQTKPRNFYPVLPAAELALLASINDDFDQAIVQYQKVVPYRPETTIADYYQLMINRVAVEAIRLRLANLTRSTDVPWLSASFSSDYFFGLTRIYNFSLSANPGEEVRAFSQLATEVERIRQHGFTASEVQRTIDMWRTWLTTLDIEDQDVRSDSFADEYVRNFMYGEPVPGIVNERVYIRDSLDRMTPASLLAEARRILSNDEGFVSVRTTRGLWNSQLTRPVFDQALAQARQQALTALADGAGQIGLFDNLPKPGRITGQAALPDDIQEFRLSNGARVLLKPTLFDRDTVRFLAFAEGGYTSWPAELHDSLSLAPSLLGSAGYGQLDSLAFDTVTAAYRANLSWGFDQDVRLIHGETTRQDLAAMLRLVYLLAAEPGQDVDSFNRQRDLLASQFVGYANDPDYRFQTAWNRHLYGDNPRLAGLSADVVRAIDFASTRQAVLDGFANAAAFTYVLIGDFSIEEVKPLLEQHLGAIPAGQSHPSQLLNPLTPRADGNGRHDFAYAREPRSSVRMVWSAPAEWSYDRQKTLEYLTYALNNRLLDALREDLGGTYVVSVDSDFRRSPVSQFSVIVSFDTHPDKVDSLVAEVDREIASLLQDGLPAMYIQQIRAAVGRSLQGRQNTNEFWLGGLLQAMINGQDFNLSQRELATVNLVDGETFRSLAAEVFQSGQRFVYVMKPQAD
ncbi:MAG: hypothetical protein A2087_02875 [Spirochaetes bacterium GWD1_61_31]|nr:MAG: hypothetical protein A2Y37_03770 [Spirochaetes bacterium GWB1_60_80]OHD28597.1 MAG: hypothetical protein A2004_06035 [Spirochaetes bacterium GWC1_61_12]OHD37608.1 MAG: hypothetical protein A2087_02875 [Spirochaetes bacterium GWD1_61_31]OHD44336.1 MAG: hypothetical protein A2Y35_09450 [Spirochaetes bacterium GWE1_60_18]OHD61020.1 MAG: hypothetical protein A2Y32_05035 [Spirochaetes bacterium GWF1_60_12]HAP44764.1 hypothetical protein [Spirochaetaceae bacterium]